MTGSQGRAELEARILSVVAEHLGVGVEELEPGISLTDDLAADSLDVVEIALALEEEFGITLPQRLLDGVRTCADLVQATLVRARRRDAVDSTQSATVLVRARVSTPDGMIERVLFLTPYNIETIVEDTLRWGTEASLHILVPPNTSAAILGGIRERLTALSARGVHVEIRREHRAGELARSTAA